MPTKILIVDDDATICTLARVGLDKAGFTTMTAHNGQDALMKIRLRHPDIVITDVNMPDVDGIDLIVSLRANESTKSIPIIVMTASGYLEENFSKIGIKHFIPKPFKIDDLIQKINNALPKTTQVS